MSDARIVSRRRNAAQAGLVAGPLLLLVGSAVRPEAGDTPRSLLATVSENPHQWLIGWSLTMVGATLILPGLAVLLRSLKGRGAVSGTVGACLTGVGLVGLIGLGASEMLLVPVAGPGELSPGAVAIVERLDTSPALALVFLLFLPGMFLGVPMLFVGLYRAGAVPLWSLLCATSAIVVDFVLSDVVPHSGAVFGTLLTVAVLGAVAPVLRPAALTGPAPGATVA